MADETKPKVKRYTHIDSSKNRISVKKRPQLQPDKLARFLFEAQGIKHRSWMNYNELCTSQNKPGDMCSWSQWVGLVSDPEVLRLYNIIRNEALSSGFNYMSENCLTAAKIIVDLAINSDNEKIKLEAASKVMTFAFNADVTALKVELNLLREQFELAIGPMIDKDVDI